MIAWMRHRTTAYDRMAIPRVKGKRREVRRLLAQHSKVMLDAYRTGREVDASACPLQAGTLGRGGPGSKRPRREATCRTGG